jgi:hypothetical protein
VARRPNVYDRAIEDYLTGVYAVGPEQTACQFGSSGTDQPREPDDLAASQRQVDVMEHAAAGQAAHLQTHRRVARSGLGEQAGEISADHHADQKVF